MPILLILLILPLLEIAGFVVVGGYIGVLPTVGLVIGTALAGAALLRIQGFGVLARIRAATEQGRMPAEEMVNGLMIMLAGVLLLLPGFITDLLGLLLFIPPVRTVAWRFLRSRVTVIGFPGSQGGPAGRRNRTIDLDAADYSETGSPDSPWRRIDRD